MSDTVTIASRFNGPADSGNGGYSCGLLAAFIDGPARVRLHAPPPLDTPLAVVRHADGRVDMRDGDTVVGTAWPAPLELDVPPAPGLAAAADAATRFRFYEGHLFPTCFVCGPGRAAHDGLEIFAGPVRDWSLLAAPWQPAPDLLDADGAVRGEFVWAALDCPGCFAAIGENERTAVLGELHAERLAPVPGDAPLVAYAWPLGQDGRKLFAGTALATAQGAVLARARAVWIALGG
jgi:hypothetical protein